MSGISAIYILDNKGRVLISRLYKANMSPAIIDTFNSKLIEYSDETAYRPIFIDSDNVAFMHLKGKPE